MTTTEVPTKIIADLRSVATVDVVVDAQMNSGAYAGKIVVESTKLHEIVCKYDEMCTLSHRSWSNLPPPPVDERAHVFIWMLICKHYAINHSTIRWPSSTPNTFVHLWSIVERMKSSLACMDMNWLMGSRTCVEYCSTTGMDGPMDANMYVRDSTPTEAVKAVSEDVGVFTHSEVVEEFSSYMEFHMSTRVPVAMEVVDVSKMYLDSLKRA